MLGHFNTRSVEGTSVVQPNSSHCVSLWYVPGGYKYDKAKVIESFFCDEGAAKRYAAKWADIPHMAVCMTMEQYLAQKDRNTDHTWTADDYFADVDDALYAGIAIHQ